MADSKSGRSESIYGGDPQGYADSVNTLLSTPDPTLDVHGETDGRAKSEGNHGKQG